LTLTQTQTFKQHDPTLTAVPVDNWCPQIHIHHLSLTLTDDDRSIATSTKHDETILHMGDNFFNTQNVRFVMRSPIRQYAQFLLVMTAVSVVCTTSVAAQQPALSPREFSLFTEFLVAAVFSAVVSTGLVKITPAFTRDSIDLIRSELLSTLWYGLAISLALIIVCLILFITVFGILLAIPLILVAAIYAHLGYLMLARQFTKNWTWAIVIASILSGVFTIVPIVGPIVGSILAMLGIGATYQHVR